MIVYLELYERRAIINDLDTAGRGKPMTIGSSSSIDTRSARRRICLREPLPAIRVIAGLIENNEPIRSTARRCTRFSRDPRPRGSPFCVRPRLESRPGLSY